MDASGHRLPPAPFLKDLPLVEDLGFPLGTETGADALALLALGLSASRRARRRR